MSMSNSDKEVNYHIIYTALNPLGAEEARCGDLGWDPDDSVAMKKVFIDLIVPHIQGWPAFWREKLKRSLAYYINQPKILEYEVLVDQDISMHDPTDYSAFFRVLWEALFPGERLEDISLEGVVENNDIMEINKIYGVKFDD
jgi:hypothetical protein